MLKFFKKRTKLDQIISKTYGNRQELHENLKKMGVYYEYRQVRNGDLWYLIRIDNTNHAYKCIVDEDERCWLIH
jgi:hypothetical protein